MSFIKEYYTTIVMCCIPYSLGTILIVLSPFIKNKNEKLAKYSVVVGVVISILTAIVILNSICGIISRFI